MITLDIGHQRVACGSRTSFAKFTEIPPGRDAIARAQHGVLADPREQRHRKLHRIRVSSAVSGAGSVRHDSE